MADDIAALFAANQHRLFKYFCRAVGETETARDLTQDVFVRVSKAAIPAASDGEVRAWLFKIARNLAIDRCGDAEPMGAGLVKVQRPAAIREIGHPGQTG